ncbi:hypothetical protein TNCV_3681121 [Trichonephila clavipes]|uniref:Transposase Tc1-like domain-containing protein n=1 Tax=Trichonephila clavipes TaxID=2585209 RepID=A0A8X6RAJ5_TRICX|nr:hypothetical protein TNCV_3681121 [Trichonephila clavipes]
MSDSSIRRRLLHRARVPLYRIPLTANHRWLSLQWAREHRAWQADWHQDVFSDESRASICGTMMSAFVTVTAGSDVVQSGRPIFDDFFQHLWTYIGNNTANAVFQMAKSLCLIRIDQ